MKVVKIPHPKKVKPEKPSLVGTPRPSGDKRALARWMKVNPTPSEKLFHEAWQQCAPHIKLQCQPIILGFIADFYVKPKKLLIEIDGGVHQDNIEYDMARDEIFKVNGFNVLRIEADKIMRDPIREANLALEFFQKCHRRLPEKGKRKRIQLPKRTFYTY